MNLHLIAVKYLGPTNTKGSRIKMTSLRFGDSVTIPYGYEYNNARDIAEAWLASKMTHKSIIGSGETPTGFIIAVDVFERMKSIEKGGV